MNNSLIKVEEQINSMTHYFGAILSLIGTGVLIVRALKTNNIGYIIGCLIFCFSLILLYTISGTYHILGEGNIKNFFRILDHSAIYILIAGSYTPYLLGVFKGEIKWILLFIQWSIAILGVFLKINFIGKFNIISVLIYLFMGWMIAFFFEDLQKFVSLLSIKLLICSGISYSVGVIFYLMDNKKFTHGIWHVFVLIGSIFNYFSIYFLI